MPVGINDALAWLKGRQKFGIRPGLERTVRTLAELGSPERDLRFIHVAGTNGKGSVCASIAAVLAPSFRVGLFVSPGFDGLRGRFFISGREIPESRFIELIETVRLAADKATPDDPLTEFEVLTVMAICYFQMEQVDIVVWEAGLGGRYDSTNVVLPEVAVITNVSLDHQEILGDTVRLIATDKAGIIKPGIPIVTGADGEALDVIRTIAQTEGAPLYQYGVHFSASRLKCDQHGQLISVRGIREDGVYRQPLFGPHQISNTAIALAAIDLLASRQPQFRLSQTQIRRGLAQVSWPGRCEVVGSSDQRIVLDGAHNPAGAAALRHTLKELCEPDEKEDCWTVVLGILADKDVERIISELMPAAKQVIVTEPKQQRALPAAELAVMVHRQYQGRVMTASTVHEAVQMALALPNPICCCGSLYTVFEARKTISEQFCL